ncbi:hypothetical protein [Quadrisphaera sp. KR29]|uniref:hypothetical protein n=1 Tax=Quadrisphaera sp. KR29 TaxID=3461391 RepID=UPI004043B4D2
MGYGALTAPSEAEKEPLVASFDMPDLSGKLPSAAHEQYGARVEEAIRSRALEQTDDEELREDLLRDAEEGWANTIDASPLSRNPIQDENWTVVGSAPAPGESVQTDKDVYLFVLRNEEAAWFKAHPSMPPVPSDVEASVLIDEGGLFHDVEELVEFRYEPGAQPEHKVASSYVRERDAIPYPDPFSEPPGERQIRLSLPEASEYGSLVVRSLPSEAQEVRLGRMLVLTVKDKPDPVYEESGEGGSAGSLDVDGSVGGSFDDDDDFNVPGWLCPTRFC